jgi:hypothetical protein
MDADVTPAALGTEAPGSRIRRILAAAGALLAGGRGPFRLAQFRPAVPLGGMLPADRDRDRDRERLVADLRALPDAPRTWSTCPGSDRSPRTDGGGAPAAATARAIRAAPGERVGRWRAGIRRT